jgi:hypothetical protein
MEEQQSQEQMKKCPKCSESIQATAKVCKHCKADLRNWFVKHKILTAILILIIIGIIGSAGGDKGQKVSSNDNKEASSSDSAVAKVESAPPVVVTAVDLVNAYSENEVSADAKYKGKDVEVSGVVSNISNGITDDDLIVSLEGVSFNSVMCNLVHTENAKVSSLKKGQKIALVCTGNSATLGSPSMSGCVIK